MIEASLSLGHAQAATAVSHSIDTALKAEGPPNERSVERSRGAARRTLCHRVSNPPVEIAIGKKARDYL